MKILLVDDSNTMRRIQKNTLISLGYDSVEEAGDGAEAYEKVKQTKYDLVLMDWNMPIMTGIDALKNIKKDPNTKDTKVMMVTSESEKTKIIEAIQAGAVNYIVKPFQAETLKEKITAVLQK